MTDTALNSLPTDKGSFTVRARGYATSAQERVSSAATATMDAAKDHPYAAAGIAVGVAAAVGGAAYAATRMGSSTH